METRTEAALSGFMAEQGGHRLTDWAAYRIGRLRDDSQEAEEYHQQYFEKHGISHCRIS